MRCNFRLFAVLIAILASGSAAFAGDLDQRHLDVELRAGAGAVCGTCRGRDIGDLSVKPTLQLFADYLFPVAQIGPGIFEAGPYAKGALLNGVDLPQIAGGLVLGYRIERWEFLANAGLAYSTERIDDRRLPGVAFSGQTKHTYDLGLSVRYEIDRYFLSGGYTHNSNGEGLSINYAGGKGLNPGYDQLFLGVGIRFDQ
ncbi:MAG TPA: hypothetical protein VFA38_10325 [Nitrospirales bacterium]|nr:hypothetical protein [Nitrospirales bacterium]